MPISSPRVSIVVPVYNGSNYLSEALDSALGQEYPNLEVLVIDDGSDDAGATAAVAARFGERIRYLRQENAGVSAALNRGLAEMTGELFSWLSHDDLLYPAKTARQVAYLAAHPGASVVGCGLDVVDGAGRVTARWCPEELLVARTGRQVMASWIFGCALLIRREVFAEVGGFDEANRTTQDLAKWLDFVHRGHPIHLMPEVLCAYRKHDESISHRARPSHHADVEALFASLLASYPLDFFSATPAPLTAAARAATYDWLGDQAQHRGALRAAQSLYSRAFLARPDPTRATTWHLLRKVVSMARRRRRRL